MSRLTYRKGKGLLVDNNIDYGTLTNVCYQNCVDKLGQLEDIEQELGIGLVTLFKALNNGAWYKDTSGNICWCDMPKFSKGDIDFNGYHTTTRMYGVIWALTRKELEK